MQPRGRRCHRSIRVRKHGLVVSTVAFIRRAPGRDIWRQRHVAALFNRLVEHRPVEREGERHLAALALRLHGGIELPEEAHPALVAEPHDVAYRKPLRRLHEGAPA